MLWSKLKIYLSYGFWTGVAISIGLFVPYAFSYFGGKLYSIFPDKNVASVVEFENKNEVAPEPFKITLGNVSDNDFVPPKEGKIIRVNLETMKLYLYENGELQDTLPVIGKGKKGSYWETPGGEYKVLYKEENHFSSTGKVWMPYSMQFFGNYFIHGWPYYPDGTNVSAGFSGGCIRLSTSDTKKVYEWSDTKTLVSIYSDTDILPSEAGQSLSYFIKNPQKKVGVSAESYLVGDLDTGEIILEKNMTAKHPIASVSKLMTSLVALDVVNQQNLATVSKSALDTYGKNGRFFLNEKIPNNQLVYPLLLESSNDAAEILAEQPGRPYFMDQMNKKAVAIGLTNTEFKDPSGLSENNQSTALDLFKLAIYIKKYKNFIFETTLKKEYDYKNHTWFSNNEFLHEAGYTGGKSGFIDAAKETVVGTFTLPLSEFNTRHIAITLLRSEDRYEDVKSILSYLKNNLYYGQESGLAVTVPNPSPQAPPEPPKREDIVMTFVGDIMLDRGVKQSVMKNFNGDYSKLFEKIGFLKEADIAFANLEGPVSDKGADLKNLYSFRMDTEVINAINSAGFSVLSIANNHIGDWGLSAFTDTLSRLKTAGIMPIGGGENKNEAETPKIVEKNGIKVGFIGFSDVGPNNLAATDTSPGILLANDPNFDSIIQNASKSVDVLVVSMHAGVEYEKDHSDRQEELAHRAIDNGARIFIGHHPHVIEDVERYKKGIIAYSLGNFIFDQPFSQATMQGLALTIKMNKKDFLQIEKKIITLNRSFVPDKITKVREN
ncbi:MAG: CapA family protein [Candidatus Paceibacterota bacterium]|jgi:poly-gamma-glutamate synthesis protein (capsule biosynthesis protein)